MRKIALIIFTFLAITSISYASHIRAGEIIAENVNNDPLTWRFTLILYTDLTSAVQSDAVEFDFGDGTPSVTVPRDLFVNIGNQTGRNEYSAVHTFNSAIGATFVVSATEENRNGCIINFDNSVNSPFHVQSEIVLNSSIGINSTPRFTQIPVVNATIGQRWVFDNGGFDPDGVDSISYEWTVPKLSPGVDVLNYRDPVTTSGGLTEDGTAPAFITLDPVTGIIVWDAPAIRGCFNIAFKAIEWKQNPFTGQFFRYSSITRDMQIVVDDIFNLRPIVFPPADTCVIAGDQLRLLATARDPDNPPDFLYMDAFGEPFEVNQSPAGFTPDPSDSFPSPASLNFLWNTVCAHVRKDPYRLVFRVDDARPDALPFDETLTDFGETYITVIGPPPDPDTAEVINSDDMRIVWQPYNCTGADSMIIYRRVGDFEIGIDSCFIGAPEPYERIGAVEINTTTFIDNNVIRGPKYCYALVAKFFDGAESRISPDVCNALPLTAPLITNVDVDVTNQNNGFIDLAWTTPFGLDSAIDPPPYRYDLYGNSLADQIGSINDLLDTTFTWIGVNTEDADNRFLLELYSRDSLLSQPAAAASSVFLESSPGGQQVFLQWTAETPWTNSGFYHRIYRRNNQTLQFEFLDSVYFEGDEYTYLDRGQADSTVLRDGVEYCYYVETKGSYFNDEFRKVLINRSQISCDIPRDSIAPCPPILSVETPNCDSIFQVNGFGCSGNGATDTSATIEFDAHLFWTPDLLSPCDTAISHFNIYIINGLDTNFVARVDYILNQNEFEYDISANPGCYLVTAVDSFQNESDWSNPVCYEYCNYYELPNVFSPNEDKVNEKYQPCNFPLNTRTVKFSVYNRWGRPVKTIENDPLINWDGLDEDGNELPSGYYFYQAEVEFLSLDPERGLETFKGWIWLVR